MTYRFKILVFGDAAVGKTTLIHKIITGSFLENTHVTIGVEFHVKKLDIDRVDTTLQIWDFGGEDRFDFFLPMYISGARGGIFVYDITNPASLQSFPRWISLINKYIPDLPILIVGAKADLTDQRKIALSEANSVVTQLNFSEVVEVSSKSGQNIDNLFENLTRRIIAQNKSSSLIPPSIPAM